MAGHWHFPVEHMKKNASETTASLTAGRWQAVAAAARLAASREDSGSTVYGEWTLTWASTLSGRPARNPLTFWTMNSTASSGVPR